MLYDFRSALCTKKIIKKSCLSQKKVVPLHRIQSREAGEIPAQSRCCDSQSDVQNLESHWPLTGWEGWTKGAISQKTCCMPPTRVGEVERSRGIEPTTMTQRFSIVSMVRMYAYRWLTVWSNTRLLCSMVSVFLGSQNPYPHTPDHHPAMLLRIWENPK